MLTSQCFPLSEDSQVGETRRAAAEICQRHSLSAVDAGKIALAITELGRNLVRHAGGGELILREVQSGSFFGLEILSVDRGPGIANVAEAFRDGYSTAGTSGTGLGALRRLSTRFDIYTQTGKGTVASCFIGQESETARFDIGAVSLPLCGEELCGDSWDLMEQGSATRLLVADGLGHGPFAAEASREAVLAFRSTPDATPAPTMDNIHLALAKTRGASASIIRLDHASRQLASAGIGNVSMRLIIDEKSKSLISDNGTLGGMARRAREATVPWTGGTIIVMHSDGVGTRWDLSDYPGALNRHPSIIAGLLYRDHERERDDSTVIVLKEKA